MSRQRRSLSLPRTRGRISRDGLTATATVLVEALTAAQTDDETADTFTHPFHTYPARLHPATAKVLVEWACEGAGRTHAIVDPFCGSGTVLVEARANGVRAVGIDLNPLAVLVARAKTWTVPPRRRNELRSAAQRIARATIEAGKAARRSGAEAGKQRKPAGFDPNARDRRLASWFAPHVRRELEHLSQEIDKVRASDAELAGVLHACLSAILYKVSSRTSDTDATWVDRKIGRGAAARLFVQRAELLVAGLDDLSRTHGPLSELFELDARRLGDVIPDASVAGIVTSPPYPGTYDYAEHQRLRFDFLALRHRDLDAGELGPRRAFEHDPPAAYRAWRAAHADVLAAIARALAPGRAAVLVMGDSVASGRALYAMDELRDALPGDLVVEAWASQERPMLGAGERRAFGERLKAEHAVALRKPA